MGIQVPKLEGDALRAVQHRGRPLQIIAAAGSGKTEVVSQRVADLVADGVAPNSIVAFTFTEKAAEELKRRIELRVEARLGKQSVDRLNGCYIGTIHAYCFELLREHVAKYESYDLLDENRLAAFLSRERKRTELDALGPKHFDNIENFVRNIQVVENDLISLSMLAAPFRDVAHLFNQRLETYKFLTFGKMIELAVKELDRPEVRDSVLAKLRHLIVDEYQDVNPAQEALIAKLAKPPVELCVVGDDDQSIYQWRGSDVQNIIGFAARYNGVATYKLLTNRRSRPQIIATSNRFAATIQQRLAKEMLEHRKGGHPEITTWKAATETEEADLIARSIQQQKRAGYRYSDIAILVRASTSYPKLLEALAEHGVPVQPGGRTGLFQEADAQLFGRTFAYLVDREWRAVEYGARGSKVRLPSLVKDYVGAFKLDARRQKRLQTHLEDWRQEVEKPSVPADLVGQFYDLLGICGVGTWDFNDVVSITRLGNLARCSAILADYESVRRRARPDENAPGQVVGGNDRGAFYYQALATHIQNWALGKFEGFEGEDTLTLDAVDLTTVHKAKGLEWPIVYVPCVSAKRFPSSKTGRAQQWLVPEGLFDRTRYEGTENDERRLFYVAMTRARDWLSVSTHDTPAKQRVAPSPFLLQVSGGKLPYLEELPAPPPPETRPKGEDLLAITFSELANYKSCALSYRLRHLIGFQPRLAPELGYGKAVHHIMRTVAEYTRKHQTAPTAQQLDLLFDQEFYLPAANKPAHEQMRQSARKLVDQFVTDYGNDLSRIWAVERPFELHLSNAVVSGRADVILNEEDGADTLSIVDYKTAAGEDRSYDWQLQVYADAGRREGLDVRSAYVHDLHAGRRTPVDIAVPSLQNAEAEVISLVNRLKAREFIPSPGPNCSRCDVKAFCSHAVKSAS